MYVSHWTRHSLTQENLKLFPLHSFSQLLDTVDTEIKVPSVEYQELSKVLPLSLKPGVGQNIGLSPYLLFPLLGIFLSLISICISHI